MTPRCGKPLAIYERGGTAVPDKYAGYGPAIRQARRDAGLTQTQLAAVIGVYGHQVISAWELGLKYPRKGAAELERVLGISLGGPSCGRPEGHRGPCRSREALARYHAADVIRIAAWRERLRAPACSRGEEEAA